jgi:hypothetical protein
MTTKLALSMTPWKNLHSFEWFTNHYDTRHAETNSLIGSLFGLMPSLQTLLTAPTTSAQHRQERL